MKKVFNSLLVSGLVLGGATAAQAADLSILFENTVEMSASMNGGAAMTSQYHYNADGTVHVVTPQGESSGTWAVNGDEMCTNLKSPNGQEQKICNPVADMEGASIGDSWEFSPAEGLTIKGALVAGR